MRIPQVTDRLIAAPGHALRAVFTGIGQVFLAADRLKEQGAALTPAEDGPALGTATLDRPAPGEQADRPAPGGKADRGRRASAAAASAAAAEARWRSLDKTGNVRLLSHEDLMDDLPGPPAPAATAGPTAPAQAEPTADGPTEDGSAEAEPIGAQPIGAQPIEAQLIEAELIEVSPADTEAPAAAPTATAATDELPVPQYDSLSLPSLRARLRNLDAAQLQVLTEYERSHARRPTSWPCSSAGSRS